MYKETVDLSEISFTAMVYDDIGDLIAESYKPITNKKDTTDEEEFNISQESFHEA